jgi:hypothetical protein
MKNSKQNETARSLGRLGEPRTVRELVLRPDAGTFDEPVSARASLRRFGFLALVMVPLLLIATAN